MIMSFVASSSLQSLNNYQINKVSYKTKNPY